MPKLATTSMDAPPAMIASPFGRLLLMSTLHCFTVVLLSTHPQHVSGEASIDLGFSSNHQIVFPYCDFTPLKQLDSTPTLRACEPLAVQEFDELKNSYVAERDNLGVGAYLKTLSQVRGM